MTVTLEDIKRHPYLQAYILQADSNLRAMGYTEHGHRHINLVSSIAHNILVRLGFPERKGSWPQLPATSMISATAWGGSITGPPVPF